MAWDNRKRIQFARGQNDKIVETSIEQVYGQPVYNKDKHYLTIGDGGKNANSTVPIRVRTLQGWYADTENINGGTTGDTFSLSKITNTTKADQYIFTADASTTYISTGKPLYFYKPSTTAYNGSTLMVLASNAEGVDKHYGFDIKVNTLLEGDVKLSNNTIITAKDNSVTIPDSTDTLVNLAGIQSLSNKTVNNIFLKNISNNGEKTIETATSYTLRDACAKNVIDNSSAKAIGTSESVPTERSVYYGLPTINGSHSYTSSTTIYAPTTQLSASTSKRYLVGASSATSISTVSSNTSCYMQSNHLYSDSKQVINVGSASYAQTIKGSLTIDGYLYV